MHPIEPASDGRPDFTGAALGSTARWRPARSLNWFLAVVAASKARPKRDTRRATLLSRKERAEKGKLRDPSDGRLPLAPFPASID